MKSSISISMRKPHPLNHHQVTMMISAKLLYIRSSKRLSLYLELFQIQLLICVFGPYLLLTVNQLVFSQRKRQEEVFRVQIQLSLLSECTSLYLLRQELLCLWTQWSVSYMLCVFNGFNLTVNSLKLMEENLLHWSYANQFSKKFCFYVHKNDDFYKSKYLY